jgi:enoyl-CoA hydratase
MSNYKDYRAIRVDCKNQVATISILPAVKGDPLRSKPNIHPELGRIFTELRGDNSIRVIVITGDEGGCGFLLPPPRDSYLDNKDSSRFVEPVNVWNTWLGVIRTHQGMAEIEKPIVAKVNGDAMGFGQSVAFASDIIVAREDARFMDHHMSGVFAANYSGVVKEGGHEYSSIPGDGAGALVPLFMTPAKAKEYLMLAKPYTAAELARLGIINYAVPAAELDEKVDDIVNRLLERSAYALAWSKRVANKRVVEQLNMALDSGQAYEWLVWTQREKLGWVEKKTLD